MNKIREKLLIIGAGGFGKVVLEHAMQEYECAFIDDGINIGAIIHGCKVVGNTADLDKLHSIYRMLIVAIGNNRVREEIYKKAEDFGYTFPNIICKSAYISSFAKIGKGCVILNNVVIQNGAVIGNGVILNPGVEIHHESTVGNNVLIYTNSVIRTGANILDRAWIGSTLTISNDVVVAVDEVVSDGKTKVNRLYNFMEDKV